jgi:hypothetical protein
MYSAEFVWPSEDKSFSCTSLKPASNGRQEELRFTFDVSKCYHIFDELLKLGNIKTSHTMPPLDGDVHIVNIIILILMLLMIAMCFVARFNRP